MKLFFYKKAGLLLLFLSFSTVNYAQHFLQDSLSAITHDHTPWEILSGSGNDSIVCYKSTHRDIYLLVTGLVIIIALIAIKLLLLNKRTNKMLQKQNVIIEEKNKDITDSINYAKRLQNAILPSKEAVNRILPEHFILYQPKDIVSGDFYWVSQHDNKSLFAAVDCTGHGVPGALLSIVGHNAINQSVNEAGITQPSKVLDSMSRIIKNVLNQDKENEIRDGMDMALCMFDKTTNTLEYSGANNPLYIISDEKLMVVKPSRMTVGSIEDPDKEFFINHTLQVKKGDCIYIFSDGYVDQFGGNDNKKFKTSRLQELILSINKNSMEEQKKVIHQKLKNWQGNNEQVDDILVIGVRI